MKKKLYKNRKPLLFIGVLLTIFGILLAYFKWGTEPEETISGVFCGVGISLTVFLYGIKKPEEL